MYNGDAHADAENIPLAIRAAPEDPPVLISPDPPPPNAWVPPIRADAASVAAVGSTLTALLEAPANPDVKEDIGPRREARLGPRSRSSSMPPPPPTDGRLAPKPPTEAPSAPVPSLFDLSMASAKLTSLVETRWTVPSRDSNSNANSLSRAVEFGEEVWTRRWHNLRLSMLLDTRCSRRTDGKSSEEAAEQVPLVTAGMLSRTHCEDEWAGVRWIRADYTSGGEDRPKFGSLSAGEKNIRHVSVGSAEASIHTCVETITTLLNKEEKPSVGVISAA